MDEESQGESHMEDSAPWIRNAKNVFKMGVHATKNTRKNWHTNRKRESKREWKRKSAAEIVNPKV